MYRKNAAILKDWIQNSNKALLVTGARQTGKTWLIRDEIEKSGLSKFEINFIDQPDMITYLNAEMTADEFLIKLKLIMPESCKPNRTVIFLDEIQKCPEIVTKIKFLVDEGSFKYVLSGSLLGVELKGIASVPVGYMSVLHMYPMDFAIELCGKIIPIEVKSGNSYKKHKALDNFLNVPDYHLDKGYVLSIRNIEQSERIVYLPIYMTYLIKEPTTDNMIINLDLSSL